MREPIRVRVLFFARAHDLAGTSSTELELAGPATARDLDRVLRDRYEWLDARLGAYRLAVDQSFADPDTPVPDGAEVAIIPPVSGG